VRDVTPYLRQAISDCFNKTKAKNKKTMLSKALLATITLALQSAYAVNLTLDLES